MGAAVSHLPRLRTAFHGLTDQLPPQYLVCDWRERLGAVDRPSTGARRQVPQARLIERHWAHRIGGTEVHIYSAPKSLADAFRNSKLVGRSVAIEALKTTLTQRKAAPADLIQAAADYGAAMIMRPYKDALISVGLEYRRTSQRQFANDSNGPNNSPD